MNSREWSLVDAKTRAIVEHFQNEAPIRVSAIASALSVPVKAATLQPGISGEIRPNSEIPGGFLIRVSRHDPSVRQRFTVAHELGHFLLHRDQIGTGIFDDVLYRSSLSDRREAEANRIAADILMPEPLIKLWLDRAAVLGIDDKVEFLKDRFEVSEAAMKIRLGLS